jgi:hypothetical protein
MRSISLALVAPLLALASYVSAQTHIPAKAKPAPLTPAMTAAQAAKIMADKTAGRIVWSATRPLTAEDFQARPGPSETLAALTSSNIDAQANCRDFMFAGTVQATFDPATSWIRNPKTVTEKLLRHEQLHFDLSELYARRMRQKLRATTFDCLKLQPTFNRITKLVYDAWERDENRYDQDTNHGLNDAKQAFWENQVKTELEKLKEFAL